MLPRDALTTGMIALCSAALLACEPQDRDAPPADAAASEVQPASRWVAQGDAALIALAPDEADDAALRDAIAEARRTAADARQRWRSAPPDERSRWAVKWAAPTAEGGLEHVWIRPLHWSRFRIEGTLASRPHSTLAGGADRGDLVAFPADELVDWLLEPPARGVPREGGFTITVLEQRFGRPGREPAPTVR